MSNNKVKAEWVLSGFGDNTRYYECSNCFETCVGKDDEDTRHISEIFPHCDCCGAEMIKD